jgi:hypothetical protein
VSGTTFGPSRRRLTALRTVAQHLGRAELTSPTEVVRRLLALQGQDFPGAKWSIGLRQARATEAVVEAACDAGEIVRSWPLRGTLHLVAGEDLGWLLALTAPRAMRATAGRRASLGITEADVEKARETAQAALTGRRVLMRDALIAAFEAAGVSTVGQRGYHVLWYLAQTGTLVLGATNGRNQTFALLDEWVPQPRRLDGDEALAELALRYFHGHGPATAADLARWSGLTVGDVRRGIAICGRRLTTLDLDGVTYILAPDTLARPAPSSRVHLLPGFDEYLLGYGDRSAALAPEHSDAIAPGGNGMFKPTIVVDGEVVGTWKRTARAREIVIEVAPFAHVPDTVRDDLQKAVLAYGAFVGRPARLAGLTEILY